jgi:hypothetical protein
MTGKHLAGVAIAILLIAPFEVSARSGPSGLGARSFHPAGSAVSKRPLAHRGAFRRHRWPGGVIAAATYDGTYNDAPGYIGATLADEGLAPLYPPRALNCQRRRETWTVPSEAGGTRQVTVTRC